MTELRFLKRDKVLLPIAITIAFVVWYFLFAVPGTPFWVVMSFATFILGGVSLVVYSDTLQGSIRDWGKYILIGLIASLVLYLIFAAGNYVIRYLPLGEHQIESVYSTRSQASRTVISLLLLFPIGPGEELFWRGWIQRSLMHKYGSLNGFLYTTLLYTLVHLPSFNLVLITAALFAGAFWGILYWRVGHIGPGIISHAFWDVAVFTVIPFM